MIRVERDGEDFEIRELIPLLPLRDIVIYPYMTIPLLVGRVASVNAIEQAVQKDRIVFVLAQKKPEVGDPGSKDLYRVGAVVRVLQLFRLGDAGCFSFYPSKNLGAYGDGGMIVLNDGDVAEEIRKLRNHGSRGGYVHECLGYNSRLDEIQACVLLVKFRRIMEYNGKRRERAALYTSMLSDIVACPVERDGAFHVYHQYTLRSPRRDEIQRALREQGIPSVVYYPIPLHLQAALRDVGHGEGDFPVAESAAREVLSLPLYPELEDADVRAAAETIRQTDQRDKIDQTDHHQFNELTNRPRAFLASA